MKLSENSEGLYLKTDELSEQPPKSEAPAVQTPVISFAEDEDAFVAEMRQLAGMDEPKAEPELIFDPEPEAEQKPQSAPVEKQPRVSQVETRYDPQPVEEKTGGVAGWIKGLAVLVAAAAILILTVIAVSNGLQPMV